MSIEAAKNAGRVSAQDDMAFGKAFRNDSASAHGGTISQYDPGQYHRTEADPAVISQADGRCVEMAARVGGVMGCADDGAIGSEQAVIANFDTVHGLDIAAGHVARITGMAQFDAPGLYDS